MKKINQLDNILYYLVVVLTLGGAFFSKIIVKKAISEMNNKE